MKQKFNGALSRLDQVRKYKGIEGCKAVFQEIYERDKRRAVMLLNDRYLTFPCLYILSPQIEPVLYPYIRPRLVVGLRFISNVREADDQRAGSHTDKTEYAALKWIIDTGHGEDGLDDAYEEILEHAVSVLINTYQNTGILPEVADMIFDRNKKGHNIHDLVWAYFRSCHPDTLKLIAERIRAAEGRDVDLACTLLHIHMPESDTDRQKQYQSYLQWLTDNAPFLYFTGESMQYANTPVFCRIDMERKYMQRGTPTYHRKPVVPANGDERKRLEVFASLRDEEKAFLSERSHNIYKRDPAAWKEWMQYPIEEQMRIAKAEGEGSL